MNLVWKIYFIKYFIYTTIQNLEVSKSSIIIIILNEYLLRKDAVNWSKVTVKTFIM